MSDDDRRGPEWFEPDDPEMTKEELHSVMQVVWISIGGLLTFFSLIAWCIYRAITEG